MSEQAPEIEPKADPVLEFVVEGVKLSLSQNRMTREQAVAAIKRWYPEAEILLDADIPDSDG